MKRFVLTEQAEADLNEAWEYVAESNLDAADQLREELYTAMQKLADMPGMGRLRLELADERHRFWIVRPYVIVYRHDTNPLQIIRIIHGARDIENLLCSPFVGYAPHFIVTLALTLSTHAENQKQCRTETLIVSSNTLRELCESGRSGRVMKSAHHCIRTPLYYKIRYLSI
jgi:plasmid stabilization system protein ParE